MQMMRMTMRKKATMRTNDDLATRHSKKSHVEEEVNFSNAWDKSV